MLSILYERDTWWFLFLIIIKFTYHIPLAGLQPKVRVYWVHPHLKCKIQKIQLDFITSSLLPCRYCFRISNLSYFLVTRELHLLLPTALRMRHVRVCDLRKLLNPLLYFCATPPPPLAIPGYGPDLFRGFYAIRKISMLNNSWTYV